MADSPDLVHADPGTHALLMGVGKYSHRSGGDGASSEAADGMQQLSSPQSRPRNCGLVAHRVPVSRTSGWPVIPSCSVRQSRSRSSTRGRVRNRRGAQPIDVLVFTHVDQDHILGVLAMLKDVERPAEFSDIWFNGFDQLNDNEFESFGPVDGEFLSTAIIEQACRGTTRSAGGRSRWVAPRHRSTTRPRSRSSLRIALCSRS